nr:MAG TPA: hypothetical protein [Caudoviricetes sp.]
MHIAGTTPGYFFAPTGNKRYKTILTAKVTKGTFSYIKSKQAGRPRSSRPGHTKTGMIFSDNYRSLTIWIGLSQTIIRGAAGCPVNPLEPECRVGT